MKKKVALLMALVMVISMLPMSVFGARAGQVVPSMVPHWDIRGYQIAIDAAHLSRVPGIDPVNFQTRRLYLEIEVSEGGETGIGNWLYGPAVGDTAAHPNHNANGFRIQAGPGFRMNNPIYGAEGADGYALDAYAAPEFVGTAANPFLQDLSHQRTLVGQRRTDGPGPQYSFIRIPLEDLVTGAAAGGLDIAIVPMEGWLNLTVPIRVNNPGATVAVRLRFEVPATGASGVLATLAQGPLTGEWANGITISSAGPRPLINYAVLGDIRLLEDAPGRLVALRASAAAGGGVHEYRDANQVRRHQDTVTELPDGQMRHIVRLVAPRGFRWDTGTMFGTGAGRVSAQLYPAFLRTVGENIQYGMVTLEGNTAVALEPMGAGSGFTWINPVTNLHEIYIQVITAPRSAALGAASTRARVDISGLALVAMPDSPTTGDVAIDVTVGSMRRTITNPVAPSSDELVAPWDDQGRATWVPGSITGAGLQFQLQNIYEVWQPLPGVLIEGAALHTHLAPGGTWLGPGDVAVVATVDDGIQMTGRISSHAGFGLNIAAIRSAAGRPTAPVRLIGEVTEGSGNFHALGSSGFGTVVSTNATATNMTIPGDVDDAVVRVAVNNDTASFILTGAVIDGGWNQVAPAGVVPVAGQRIYRNVAGTIVPPGTAGATPRVISVMQIPTGVIAGGQHVLPRFGQLHEGHGRWGNWHRSGLVVANLDFDTDFTVAASAPVDIVSGRQTSRWLHGSGDGDFSISITENLAGTLFDTGQPTRYELRVVQPGVHIVDAQVRGRRGNANIAGGAGGNISTGDNNLPATYTAGWQFVEVIPGRDGASGTNDNFVPALTDFDGGVLRFATRAIATDVANQIRALQIRLMLSVEAGFAAEHGDRVEVEVWRNGIRQGSVHVANVTDPIEVEVINRTEVIYRQALDILAPTMASSFVVRETAPAILRSGDELWFHLETTQDGRRVRVPGAPVGLFLGEPTVNEAESNMEIQALTVAAPDGSPDGVVRQRIVRPSRDVPGEITFHEVLVAGTAIPGLEWHVVVSGPQITPNDRYFMNETAMGAAWNVFYERSVFHTMAYSAVVLYVDGDPHLGEGDPDRAPGQDPAPPTDPTPPVAPTFVSPTRIWNLAMTDATGIALVYSRDGRWFSQAREFVNVFLDPAYSDIQWVRPTITIEGRHVISGQMVTVILTLDSPIAIVNGTPVDIETFAGAPERAGMTTAFTVDGRTMVPLRFLGNAFGVEVEWLGGGQVQFN